MPKKVLLCEHYDTQVIHPEDKRCPLCESLRIRSVLIRRLETGEILPPLPPGHWWALMDRGAFQALGPDMGHCDADCSHPPIPDIPLTPPSKP